MALLYCMITISQFIFMFGNTAGFSDDTKPTALYVGQIPSLTTEEELKAKFHDSMEVRIIKDHSTGLSKG